LQHGGLYYAKKKFGEASKNMMDNPYMDRKRASYNSINDTPSMRRRLNASGDIVLGMQNSRKGY